MKLEKAIQILTRHNKWRRGEDLPPLEPKVIGEAIDTVIKHYYDNPPK